MSNHKTLLISFLLIATFVMAASAQKVKPTPTPAPAPTPMLFTSAAEKFSIELPAKPSVTREIKAGEMFGVAKGMQYTWAMKEGSISVALATFDEPMRSDNDFLSFAAGMKESVEMGSQGKIISEKVDKTGKYRLIEIYFTVPDGRLMLTRWHVSNTEYYNIMTVLKKNDPADKEFAVKTMDSFKILDGTGGGITITGVPNN